ncbi:MAG: hypothetical protein J7641_12870 [Cyanobacteria bacterium SID2]|nr:hypothetical protein [Cyanobacteria bacterium SID2]MBP0004049.1 hypothetical protein [Cyanobacteria bacterium SBC]
MEYLVAVLPDRIQAEAAYTALEKAELPSETLAILGSGYQSADEFGLADPNETAKKRALQMMTWLVPFGFLGGVVFDRITGLQTFPVGVLGNQIIGGFLGAIAGAMGGLFVGGGIGALIGAGDALPYRNRLRQGKYLVVVRGSRFQVRDATSILRSFRPESLQGYSSED